MGRFMGACKGSAGPRGGLGSRRDLGRGQSWAWEKVCGSGGQEVSSARAAPSVSVSFFSLALSDDFHSESSSSASYSAA